MKDEKQTIEELTGICQGILADGSVVASEATFLQSWLESTKEYQNIPAIERLHKRVANMLSDDKFTKAEAQQLKKILQQLVLDAGKTLPQAAETPPSTKGCVPQCNDKQGLKLISADQDVFDKPNSIDFTAAFCFTGIFAYGERVDCENTAKKLGGTPKKDPLGTVPCYVVVGSIASPDWFHGNYGRKIEKAMLYRSKGKPVMLIHEDVWAELLK